MKKMLLVIVLLTGCGPLDDPSEDALVADLKERLNALQTEHDLLQEEYAVLSDDADDLAYDYYVLYDTCSTQCFYRQMEACLQPACDSCSP